jgi:Tol biopolymer transport system component
MLFTMSEASEDFLQTVLDLVVPCVMKLSPDGSSVVYSTRTKWNHCRKDKKKIKSLWIAKTGQPGSSRRLTNYQSNDRSPQWSPDGKSVAFLSNLADTEARKEALYLLSLDEESSPRALTATGNEKYISKFALSPDGNHIAFIAAPEKTPEQRAKEEAQGGAIV